MIEKLTLERVQRSTGGNPLDGRNRLALSFGREHQTRRRDASVHDDRARAAITGGATFLGAGQADRIAERGQQRVGRIAEKLDRFVVDARANMNFHPHRSFARVYAIDTARLVSTPTTRRRYATVPRLSSIGCAAAVAAAAARASAASSTRDPISASAAAGTKMLVGATAPIAMRAAVHTPFASRVRLAPALATAMSISERGISRR